MAAVQVALVKALWSGTSGGPGITQFAMVTAGEGGVWDGTKAQTAVNAVRTFLAANPTTISNDISIVVQPTVDVFGAVTGNLEESFTAATPPATVNGGNAGSYSMATGIKVNFKTTSIRNNRRVRGGIYIVPCAGDVFDANGQVSSTPRTNWLNAATAMRTSLVSASILPVVWSRPTAKGANDGAWSEITSFEVPAKGCILRGRRD